MEVQNYLGIYMGKERATVVCLNPNAENGGVVGSFSVSVEDQEQASLEDLAGLIAQGCAQRELQFAEAVVALDCSMFMQHNVHSEFSDARQIKPTIRFDAEESLATDISTMALAFEILSSNEYGSEVTVFTAEQETLKQVLTALQSNGIDPAGIEPDIVSLARLIDSHPVDDEDGPVLFGLLSHRNGYLIPATADEKENTWKGRTFLVGRNQDRSQVLAREVLVTSALVDSSGAVGGVRILDAADEVDCGSLSERLARPVSRFQLNGEDISEEGHDPVALAIARGAAQSLAQSGPTVDFRRDFMPYQGRRLRLESALKFMSISLTVLLVAVGLYFQLKLMRTNSYRSKLRAKFSKDYAAVMRGDELPDNANPIRKLESVIRELERGGGGGTGDDSPEALLVSVLNAINKCASTTDINIDRISINSKNVVIAGDTKFAQNRNTLRFFNELRQAGLTVSHQRMSSAGGRDSFNVTVTP